MPRGKKTAASVEVTPVKKEKAVIPGFTREEPAKADVTPVVDEKELAATIKAAPEMSDGAAAQMEAIEPLAAKYNCGFRYKKYPPEEGSAEVVIFTHPPYLGGHRQLPTRETEANLMQSLVAIENHLAKARNGLF